MTNIVLLVVDALRYDCVRDVSSRTLSKYGVKEFLNTRNMNAFAQTGTSFSQAISTAPDTPSAHASLFTGLYPPKHGIRTFFNARLPKEAKTIFEILGEAGYTTFCIADKPIFNDLMGLARGCDYFIDEGNSDVKLFELINEHKDDNIFIFQRFMDVHFPYFLSDSPPSKGYLRDSFFVTQRICKDFCIDFTLKAEDFDNINNHTEQWHRIRNHLRNKKGMIECMFLQYIQGINKFDQGRFQHYINNIGSMMNDCLFVLTADHGEAVIRPDKVEDGVLRFDHCYANIDELVRIPLIIHNPQTIPQGKVINTQVSIVDILPTILDIAGIDTPQEVQGRSLIPVINGDADSGSPAYSEHSWWNDGRYNDAKEFKKLFSSLKQACNGETSICKPLMRDRSIRTPRYRYVELGEVLDEDDWKKDDETFVRTLYRKIRANWDGLYEDDIILWLKKLESDEETREKMVKKFMADAILANRYALYNLENDPYEEANLLLIDRVKYKDIAIAMKKMMGEIT